MILTIKHLPTGATRRLPFECAPPNLQEIVMRRGGQPATRFSVTTNEGEEIVTWDSPPGGPESAHPWQAVEDLRFLLDVVNKPPTVCGGLRRVTFRGAAFAAVMRALCLPVEESVAGGEAWGGSTWLYTVVCDGVGSLEIE